MGIPKDPSICGLNPETIRQYLESIHPKESQAARTGNVNKRRRIGAENRCATGFVVEATEEHILVLTCAHALDHVFTKSDPIPVAEINRLFEARILCDHAEVRYRRGRGQQEGQQEENERQSVRAEVVRVDCKMDLLLLRVEQPMLTQKCQERHPAVPIAENFPESLNKVVVVSWPPYRPQTKCVGFTSHEGRDYSDVFQTNPLGYTMSLSEVSILADDGSSGAPMLNGEANAVGVLHGGSKKSLCYFTSLPDLRTVLTNWGVIGDADG